MHTHAVAIVGTGFSGLGTAIRLKQEGIDDFVVFEKADSVGGTWRDNRYPGCACDVESHLYSFSFAPNPSWSRMYSGQAEIWAYLVRCAERFGVLPHMKFRHTVEDCSWDESAQRWSIVTTQGTFAARVLVIGTGALSEPKIPRLPGIETFRGKIMHSAQWDESYSLDGKNVAVIGTGASAIQFVPHVQPKAKRLTLFQRTAPWVLPSVDRTLTDRERWLVTKFPWLQKLWRLRIYLFREFFGFAFRYPRLMRKFEAMGVRHLHRAVKDPALRKKLLPTYRLGCKRILMSNKYFVSLAAPNAQVVTEPIAMIGPEAITTQEGMTHPADVLIFGTGFQVTEMPFAQRVRGRGGVRLSDVWRGSPHAHLGTTVPGFPNLFYLMGPNTGLGHNSVVIMIESQIEHTLRALRYLAKRRLTALEVRPEAERRFLADVERRMERTVWVTGGCSSWYLDAQGRNTTLWPGSVGSFRRKVRPFRPSEYLATPP